MTSSEITSGILRQRARDAMGDPNNQAAREELDREMDEIYRKKGYQTTTSAQKQLSEEVQRRADDFLKRALEGESQGVLEEMGGGKKTGRRLVDRDPEEIAQMIGKSRGEGAVEGLDSERGDDGGSASIENSNGNGNRAAVLSRDNVVTGTGVNKKVSNGFTNPRPQTRELTPDEVEDIIRVSRTNDAGGNVSPLGSGVSEGYVPPLNNRGVPDRSSSIDSEVGDVGEGSTNTNVLDLPTNSEVLSGLAPKLDEPTDAEILGTSFNSKRDARGGQLSEEGLRRVAQNNSDSLNDKHKKGRTIFGIRLPI